MKNTTKFKKLISTLLLLVYVLGIVACEKDKNEASEPQKLSGEELFKQIILIDGQDIDKKIPEYAPIVDELNKLTPEQQQARKVFNDYITQEVKKNHPTYFAKLKEAVDSKQLYGIKEAVSEGNNVVMSALKNSSQHGQLVRAVENFINLNPDKYDLNSKEDKEKLVNDLREFLAKGADNLDIGTKGIIFASILFTFVVISIAVVVVYGATHDTAAVTEYYRSILSNNSNSIKFDRLILSIYKAY